MSSHGTGALSTPNVSSSRKKNLDVRVAGLYVGMYTRVARRLRVDPSHVRRVALGQRQSAKITAALATEIDLINKTVLSGNGACATDGNDSHPTSDRRAVSPSRTKSYIRMRCVLACNNGDVYARCNGLSVVTKIGRSQELSKEYPPSKFIYPRGPLIPIELYREAVI